jgi:hypothetical protein
VWVVCDAVAMSQPGSIVAHSSEDALAAESSIGSTDFSFNTKTCTGLGSRPVMRVRLCNRRQRAVQLGDA